MDFSYVNDIFHFYESNVNLHWLHDALEQMNSTEVLVDLSIATMACGVVIGFYRYRRSRHAKPENSSSNCAPTIRSADLQEHCDIERLRAIELFSEKIQLSSLADDTELLTDDMSSSSASSFAQSDDNADPSLFNISMPEKDVSDSKENGDATSVTGDGAAKVIYKKIMQDGVNARLKLLHAEKKIYAQMKKMQSLKRSLLESSAGNSMQDGFLNKTSISISRRKSFFDPDGFDKTFLKRSSTIEPKSIAEEDPTKEKLMNLKENISQLIDVHMNRLSSLYESIAENRMHAKKLEIMKKEIDSLYKSTEKEKNKDEELAAEEPNNKTVADNMAVQGEDKKSSYDKNLVNQLESINSLKSLFKNYDNEQELSTIMEKSNEDVENSLILLNDISTLQSDLQFIKKSWSRSSTPRKSPGTQPAVST